MNPSDVVPVAPANVALTAAPMVLIAVKSRLFVDLPCSYVNSTVAKRVVGTAVLGGGPPPIVFCPYSMYRLLPSTRFAFVPPPAFMAEIV